MCSVSHFNLLLSNGFMNKFELSENLINLIYYMGRAMSTDFRKLSKLIFEKVFFDYIFQFSCNQSFDAEGIA